MVGAVEERPAEDRDALGLDPLLERVRLLLRELARCDGGVDPGPYACTSASLSSLGSTPSCSAASSMIACWSSSDPSWPAAIALAAADERRSGDRAEDDLLAECLFDHVFLLVVVPDAFRTAGELQTPVRAGPEVVKSQPVGTFRRRYAGPVLNRAWLGDASRPGGLRPRPLRARWRRLAVYLL